jgi:hypothetical protein
MLKKMSFVVGVGAGYVLGARSGRARYDQIAGKAQELWQHPRVQQTVGQVQQVAKDRAGQAQQVVKEKAASATSSDRAGAHRETGIGWPDAASGSGGAGEEPIGGTSS